jgi:thiamine-phosphate pyrophosphorylase
MLKDIIEKEGFLLYVVTDDKFLPSSSGRRDISYVKDIVKRCADGGVKIFQYRAKTIEPVFQLKQALAAKEECEKNDIIFFVNDRVDLAYIIGAKGVHVGQEDIPPQIIKERFNNLMVGFSTHNIYQVRSAPFSFVDYISFGPVFGTATKKSKYPPTNVNNLRKAVKLSPVPVVAIGGINSDNIVYVVKAGCKIAASISYILENPKEITSRCREIIKKAKQTLS